MSFHDKIGNDLQKATEILRNGGLVAIPTETVYGLAANAFSEESVLKIFQAKKRPFFDPLIVHTSSLDKLRQFAELNNEKLIKLAEIFWPGPLTLLLNKKSIIPDLVTSGMERVAVRIPDHTLTLNLLDQLDFPLAAPSANPFGYISPTKAIHVAEQLGAEVDYILDGGDCEVGIESSIIGIENNDLVLYRLGGIAIEEIESVVGELKIAINKSSDPNAPGQLKSHYSPTKPIFFGHLDELLRIYSSNKVSLLCFTDKRGAANIVAQKVLSGRGDFAEATKNLFSFLRELDKTDGEIILAEKLPDTFLGKAVNDRLERAAARRE